MEALLPTETWVSCHKHYTLSQARRPRRE